MSEKRFQMGRRIDVVSDIYDSQKDKLLILSDVVDCLNEQQATISQLREENEQLKEELNNLKKDETMLYHYYTLARYGGDGV